MKRWLDLQSPADAFIGSIAYMILDAGEREPRGVGIPVREGGILDGSLRIQIG